MATAMVWTKVGAQGDDVAMQPGERYAVLASVSKNFSKDQVVAKAATYGFNVSYAWEAGDPKRPEDYNVDEWLASLPADPNDSHRFMYGEGTFAGGSPWKLGGSAPWPLTIYTLEDSFHAVPEGSAPDAFPGGGGNPQGQGGNNVAPSSDGGVPTWLTVTGVVAGIVASVVAVWAFLRGRKS